MQSSKNNYLRITIIIFYLICSFFLTSIFFCFPLRLICTAWKLWKQVHGLLFFVKPLGFFQDGLSFEMGFFSRLHILWGYSVKRRYLIPLVIHKSHENIWIFLILQNILDVYCSHNKKFMDHGKWKSFFFTHHK